MHFALLEVTVATGTMIILLFTGCAALRAATWLIGEAFFSVEILFRCCKHELGTTVTAC